MSIEMSVMYDIKVYENEEEMETIRDLKESQVIAIKRIFERHDIKYLVRKVKENDEQ